MIEVLARSPHFFHDGAFKRRRYRVTDAVGRRRRRSAGAVGR